VLDAFRVRLAKTPAVDGERFPAPTGPENEDNVRIYSDALAALYERT
jgi:hypothetical protein